MKLPLSQLSSKKKAPWRLKDVEELKASIKAMLVAEEEQGRSERQLVNFLVKAINTENTAIDPKGTLKSLLLVISLLNLYKRVKINAKDLKLIEDLSNYAYDILTFNEIDPLKSKFSFLYSDLHHALSGIYVVRGLHRRATFEYLLGFHISGKNVSGGHGLHDLTLGIRSLNLGNGDDAINFLRRSVSSELSEDNQIKAYCNLLKAYRLTGRLKEADKLEDSLTTMELCKNESFTQELIWERECRKIIETQDLSGLLNLVKSGSHYSESYALELALYAFAMQDDVWIKQVLKSKTLANKGLRRRNSFRFQSVRMFEDLYSQYIDLPIRLRKLCHYVETFESRDTININLLILLAAVRWFLRNNQNRLALFTFREYEAIAFRLNQGQSSDPLGIGADIKTLLANESAATRIDS